jgi:hypothetical protein
MCMYLDDVQQGCTTNDGSVESQRQFLILSLQFGCQWQFGNRSCINVPIKSASNDGSGLVRLTMDSTAGFSTGHTATISGLGGERGVCRDHR